MQSMPPRPCAVSWPGVIPPGVVSSAPFAFWDVLPTLADIAGIPPGALPANLDGESMKDAWMGRTPSTPHGPMYFEFCTVRRHHHATRTQYI